MMNQYVRDQLNQTSLGKITTIGDIVYASSTTALSRLGIGSTGQLLAVQGNGVPAWFSPPQLAAYSASSVAIAHNTLTGISFNALNWSVTGLSLSTSAGNSSKVSITTRGYYQWTVTAAWTGNSSGLRQLYTTINAAQLNSISDKPTDTSLLYQQVTSTYPLSTTDYIGAGAYQISGGTLDLIAGVPSIQVHWVGAY